MFQRRKDGFLSPKVPDKKLCISLNSDTGSTSLVSPSRSELNEELTKTVGSPAFFAPELCAFHDDMDLESSKYIVTKAIDIWALGVTLYCLSFGVCPFTADSEYKLFEAISTQSVTIPLDIPVSSELEDLIQRILTKDPEQRPTLDQIKRHPWTLGGLAHPEQWLSETDPIHYGTVQVTEEEVKKAFTHAVDKLKNQLRRLSSSFQSLSLFSSSKSKSKSLPSVSPLEPRPFSLPPESMIPPSSSPLTSPSSSSPSSPISPTYPNMLFPLSPLNEPIDFELGPSEINEDEVDPEWLERQRRTTWENQLPLTYLNSEEVLFNSS
ncbi:hypothetical protein HMI55_000531 [Coelomomyces lativittatus]|nr:hypothetical protein HMI55_000531 [Coelomomyces lativittatus]